MIQKNKYTESPTTVATKTTRTPEVPVMSIYYSEGLKYELNSDKKSYYSVAGIGICNDKDIVIHPEYNGLSVTSIGYKVA